ncbi:MAG TPA: nitroreductase family protein [Fluviicoccus sp.]|nr:nitroreductase family protein [Fluviicoccus sp.]
MTLKIAETSVPIHELIATRWSPRAFTSEPVSLPQQAALVEAARWAPSSYNLQPWRFLLWDRHRHPEAFAKVLATLSGTNRAWATGAPLLIGVYADSRGVDGQKNHAAAYDTGAAAISLALQAQALGLHAHQLGGFDREALRSAFTIPNEWSPQALIAVGRQGDPALLRDDLRARELAPRVRRPLAEIAFADGPDQPLPPV